VGSSGGAISGRATGAGGGTACCQLGAAAGGTGATAVELGAGTAAEAVAAGEVNVDEVRSSTLSFGDVGAGAVWGAVAGAGCARAKETTVDDAKRTNVVVDKLIIVTRFAVRYGAVSWRSPYHLRRRTIPPCSARGQWVFCTQTVHRSAGLPRITLREPGDIL
jgi:hypothetical protein